MTSDIVSIVHQAAEPSFDPYDGITYVNAAWACSPADGDLFSTRTYYGTDNRKRMAHYMQFMTAYIGAVMLKSGGFFAMLPTVPVPLT